MGRVDGVQDSIRRDNVLDIDTIGTAGVSSGGTVIDNRFITLMSGSDITANQLVGIVNGRAVVADYASIRAIGVANVNALANSNVKIQISGIVDIFNDTANIYYLKSVGTIGIYGYETGKYLQKIGNKISDNQIFLDISEFILML